MTDVRSVIACVPVDRSELPQIPELDAIVVTDLYTLTTCQACGQDVWIGPRSLGQYQGDPAAFLVLCYMCTFRLPEVSQLPVVELGGGFPREGRARVL
jgi:hypothetical protein